MGREKCVNFLLVMWVNCFFISFEFIYLKINRLISVLWNNFYWLGIISLSIEKLKVKWSRKTFVIIQINESLCAENGRVFRLKFKISMMGESCCHLSSIKGCVGFDESQKAPMTVHRHEKSSISTNFMFAKDMRLNYVVSKVFYVSVASSSG